jgi:hypothetical protein
MTRIVTTAYRCKRPAKMRKAVALEGPAIVRARVQAGDRHHLLRAEKHHERPVFIFHTRP